MRKAVGLMGNTMTKAPGGGSIGPKNAKKAHTEESPPNKTEKNAVTPGVAHSIEPNSHQLKTIYLN